VSGGTGATLVPPGRELEVISVDDVGRSRGVEWAPDPMTSHRWLGWRPVLLSAALALVASGVLMAGLSAIGGAADELRIYIRDHGDDRRGRGELTPVRLRVMP
jgi:hypothetical protein